jgi:hypothetical protein
MTCAKPKLSVYSPNEVIVGYPVAVFVVVVAEAEVGTTVPGGGISDGVPVMSTRLETFVPDNDAK